MIKHCRRRRGVSIHPPAGAATLSGSLPRITADIDAVSMTVDQRLDRLERWHAQQRQALAALQALVTEETARAAKTENTLASDIASLRDDLNTERLASAQLQAKGWCG